MCHCGCDVLSFGVGGLAMLKVDPRTSWIQRAQIKQTANLTNEVFMLSISNYISALLQEENIRKPWQPSVSLTDLLLVQQCQHNI